MPVKGVNSLRLRLKVMALQFLRRVWPRGVSETSPWQIIIRLGSRPLVRSLIWLRWWLELRDTLPRHVDIETAAECNRTCSYCPVARFPRNGQMPTDLFHSIIGQLRDMGFAGSLSFNFYNEPLLDDTLDDRISYARTHLPRATLVLISNGDYLDQPRLSQLFCAGIHMVSISLHDKKIAARIGAMIALLDTKTRKCVTTIEMFNKDVALANRGGLIDLSKHKRSSQLRWPYGGCMAVHDLEIDYRGRTALCCNDFHVENGFGDLNRIPLRQLWESGKDRRKKIYFGQYDLDICRNCNRQD